LEQPTATSQTRIAADGDFDRVRDTSVLVFAKVAAVAIEQSNLDLAS
jgi:hypothetical protein